jgi:hypothetical protein
VKRPKRPQWKVVRLPVRTHRLLKDLSAHTGVPMVEFMERVVDHIYGGGITAMQALTFFIMYLDDAPMFVVASPDAEKAEIGMKGELLGKNVKKIKAVPLLSAPLDDVQRVGIAAILSQQTQTNTALQLLLSKLRR